jgi:translation elongation factor EF-Ts
LGFFNPSSEEILHAQIKGYKKALDEKDRQIEYLTELLRESGYWKQEEDTGK